MFCLEGQSLHEWISFLIIKDPLTKKQTRNQKQKKTKDKILLSLFIMWGYKTKVPGTGSGYLLGIESTDTLISDFATSRTSRNTFLLFVSYSVCSICYRKQNGWTHGWTLKSVTSVAYAEEWDKFIK